MPPSSGGGELTLFRVSHASDHAPVWIELAGGNGRRGEFARPKTCFIPKGARSPTEMTMVEQKAYASDNAAEAVGERLESPPPDTIEQTPRPTAASTGPRARVADKTAESLGERSGDAYADATTNEARKRSQKKVSRHAATEGGSQTGGAALFRPFDQQTFVTVLAAFGLGYAAALLIHHRTR
jgi:hypothetical protein